MTKHEGPVSDRATEAMLGAGVTWANVPPAVGGISVRAAGGEDNFDPPSAPLDAEARKWAEDEAYRASDGYVEPVKPSVTKGSQSGPQDWNVAPPDATSTSSANPWEIQRGPTTS